MKCSTQAIAKVVFDFSFLFFFYWKWHQMKLLQSGGLKSHVWSPSRAEKKESTQRKEQQRYRDTVWTKQRSEPDDERLTWAWGKTKRAQINSVLQQLHAVSMLGCYPRTPLLLRWEGWGRVHHTVCWDLWLLSSGTLMSYTETHNRLLEGNHKLVALPPH